MNDSLTLFDRLKAACIDDWERFTGHTFVEKLGDGSLSRANFKHFLEQDYIFLVHFSRAWALAVYKAQTLEDMRAASKTLDALLNHEMALHIRYCREFGIDETELETAPEARANLAYTRFVLERGMAGDVLDLHVALAPCVVGYAEIGRRLALQYADNLADNPYRDWIDTYSGEDYQAVAEQACAQLDRLGRERGGMQRLDALTETFRIATLLEQGFWEMGMHLEF